MPAGRTVDGTELLRLARDGDPLSLEALLRRTGERLGQRARARISTCLRGKADSTDVVQEALLEIHLRLPRFRGTTDAEYWAWAVRILDALAANHARRYLGTRQRDLRLERRLHAARDSGGADLGPCSSSPGPSELAERREVFCLLHDALRSLPDHYREVVVLRSIEGLPCAEVAERMDRSVDSIEKLQKRALACLRRRVLGKNV